MPDPAQPALPPYITPRGDGCVLSVRVIPRAGRTGLAGTRGGTLLLRLAAPPVEGAANEALVSVLSDVLDVPRRYVQLRSGERSRDKLVEIVGCAAATVAVRLQRRLGARGQGTV